MDIFDRAQQEEESFRTYALMRHYANRDAVKKNSSRHCVDCGCSIGVARLRAVPHAVRCVECQYKMERRSRMWKSGVFYLPVRHWLQRRMW